MHKCNLRNIPVVSNKNLYQYLYQNMFFLLLSSITLPFIIKKLDKKNSDYSDSGSDVASSIE